jgi:hypothetical protein
MIWKIRSTPPNDEFHETNEISRSFFCLEKHKLLYIYEGVIDLSPQNPDHFQQVILYSRARILKLHIREMALPRDDTFYILQLASHLPRYRKCSDKKCSHYMYLILYDEMFGISGLTPRFCP